MPVELQRTLFIGLGGAGIKTILKTKSMFLERFGEVPPCVGFLGIDTDASAPHLRRAFHSNLVLLSVPDVASQYHMNKEKYSWLPEKNIEALSSSEGNSLRSTARVKFEVYRNIIKHYIVDAYHCMSAAVGADKTVPVQINLVLSLCGATGSGCFLSMGYMLKELFGESVQVDVHAVGLNDGEKVSGYAEANMYGAMLDAAYLMSKISAKSPFEMQTNEGIKSYDYKPFDRFYLTASFSRYHEMEGVCDSLGSSLFYRSTVFQPNSSFDYDCYKLSCKMLWGDFDEEDQKAWVFGHYMREIMIDTKKLSDEFSLKAGMQLVRSIIGEDYDYEMTDSAITWINKNNLCEHEADQLLDSLFDFADLKQSVIASSRGSDAKIESDTWISEGEQEASKAIEANFDERMSVIKKEIASKLSEIIASGDGLNGAKAFVNCLKTAFDIYAGEMREELVTLNKQQSGFTSEIADIIADWPRLFGIGGSKTLLQEAQKLLLTNKIDISRHVKASQLYAEMKEYLSFMEHQLAKSLLIFNEIIRMLSEMRARLAYKKVDNPFQIDLADRVHVDGNHQDNTLEKFIASLNCDNVLDLSTLEAREVMEMILAFTSSLDGADFSHVSIEDLIIVMDEGEKMCLFEKAARKSEYFLDSQYHGYPSPQEEWICVSVPEGLYGVLAQDHAFAKAIKSYSHGNGPVYAPSSSSTGIIIYRHKAPYPVFQLESIVRHKRVWEERFGFKSFSFDLAVEEKIKDENFGFLPNQRKVPYLELWVKGLIFGFIRRNGNRYEVQSMSLPYADALDDFWVTLRCPEDGMPTDYRYYACEYLKSNRKELSRRGDLLDRIRRKEHEMRRDALNQLYADVANYSDEEYVREYFTADVLLQDIIDNPIYARTKQLLDDELWYVRERLLDSVK